MTTHPPGVALRRSSTTFDGAHRLQSGDLIPLGPFPHQEVEAHPVLHRLGFGRFDEDEPVSVVVGFADQLEGVARHLLLGPLPASDAAPEAGEQFAV